MKRRLLSIFKIFFMMSFLFFINDINIYALDVINQGKVGTPGSPGSGCSYSGWQGCYGYLKNNIAMPAGYRITLIHADGTLVKNPKTGASTHSVDIFNRNEKDQDGKTAFDLIQQKYGLLYPTGVNLINQYLESSKKITTSNYPKYKYGNNDQELSFLNFNGIDNAPSDSIKRYYQTSSGEQIKYDGPAPSGDLNKMKTDFLPEIEDYVEKSTQDIEPKWYLYLDDSGMEYVKVNFLDLFLYYSDYLDLNDVGYNHALLTDYKNTNVYNLFVDEGNPVYMLIEPTYFADFNLVYNQKNSPRAFVYGTFSEYMTAINAIKGKNAENGLTWGFINNLPRNHSCDLSTSSSVSGTLPSITKDVNKGFSACQPANSNEAADINYGYGVFVINITDSIKDEHKCEGDFCVNYCSSNDGIVSFKPGKTISNAELKNSQIFWENPEADVNSRISCYDTVEYNFTNVMDSMRATKRVLTYLDVPSGYAYITRRCWVGENATAPKIQDIFDEYKISGNFQMAISAPKGKNGSTDYGFIVESIDELKQPTPVRYQDGNIYEYKLNLKYTTSPILLYSKPDRTSQKTSIFFKENAFGASNKIINNPLSDVSFVDAWGTDATRDQINDGMRCYFDMNFISGSIKFRTISLENPFPARDGTSRLPGTNWLYEDNYVFDYITNNRGVRYAYAFNHGLYDLETNSCTDCEKVTFITDRTASSQDKINVSPEAIYTELEPMYSVTLTPSTMLKIRGYNKAHQYTSMYLDSSVDYMADKLSCVDGRECYSPFLRDDSYIPNDSISGTCFFSKEKDMRKTRSNPDAYGYITKELEEEDYDYIGGYDFNKNLIFDSTDAQIAESVSGGHSKLTDFYYCANKTYLSGGPEDYGSVVRGDGE